MKRQSFLLILVLILSLGANACSTYKVTVDGKTVQGVNYDTWLEHPRIWFETNGYGAVFTGANFQGGNDLTPQSGMNEWGLSFSTLAAHTPEMGAPPTGRKSIPGRSKYLKDILHACKTVEEVQAYIEQYDHSVLSQDVFIYTDRSGKYLVVEPYQLIPGTDDKYVLANFCPSTITDFNGITQERYRNGVAFLQNKSDTSLAFYTALSDTMSVNRKKLGDGTLLTSIWDVSKGIAHLYFYHDYDHHVQFNLEKELAKGDHSYEITSLFPVNTKYQDLVGFKTPLNSSGIEIFLRICIMLFVASCFYFLISYFRNRTVAYAKYKLLLSILSLCMAYFMFVLETEIGIYYFPAPYHGHGSVMVDMAAYLPFLLLLLIIPLVVVNTNVFKRGSWRLFSAFLFGLNNLVYIVLIVLFSYWGLYNVFG